MFEAARAGGALGTGWAGGRLEEAGQEAEDRRGCC